MFVNVGFPSTSFGVYQPYIVAVPGMSHADGSLVVTVRNLSSLITIFFVAIYYKKLDCRWGIFLGTLATALGFLTFSFANNLPLFVLGAIIAGMGYGFAGTSAMTILIGKWHNKNTGTPMGIATVGSSVAGFFVPVVVLFVVSNRTLNEAFLIQSIFALITAILLFLLVKNKPKDFVKKEVAEVGKNDSQPLSKKKYYVFVFAVFLLGGACLSDIVYLSILFTTAGADPVLAAAVVSVANVALCVGKFVLGFLIDKLGTFKASIIAFAILIIGRISVAIFAGPNEVMAYISTAIFGFGTAITTVGISQWAIDLSTPSHRYKTVRDMQVAYNLGGFLTGMIPGLIAEFTGSYVPFYLISVIAVFISAIIVVKLFPKK